MAAFSTVARSRCTSSETTITAATITGVTVATVISSRWERSLIYPLSHCGLVEAVVVIPGGIRQHLLRLPVLRAQLQHGAHAFQIDLRLALEPVARMQKHLVRRRPRLLVLRGNVFQDERVGL